MVTVNYFKLKFIAVEIECTNVTKNNIFIDLIGKKYLNLIINQNVNIYIYILFYAL